MNFEHRCSMRCRWCYIPFGGGAPNRNVCLSVLSQLIARGFDVITIGGGDPTSYPFWGDLTQKAKSHGLFVHLDTNAIGLRTDSETASVLRQSVDLLGLPLDGPTAAVHDEIQDAEGHFDHLISKVQWAKKQGLQIKINTILTRRNANSVSKMLRVIERLQPVRWSLYQYWPLSLGARAQPEHSITDEEFENSVATFPTNIDQTIVEVNTRLSRRLTYPIVSHAGQVYLHSRENDHAFEVLGSVFEGNAITRALEICSGDRAAAVTRYTRTMDANVTTR